MDESFHDYVDRKLYRDWEPPMRQSMALSRHFIDEAESENTIDLKLCLWFAINSLQDSGRVNSDPYVANAYEWMQTAVEKMNESEGPCPT